MTIEAHHAAANRSSRTTTPIRVFGRSEGGLWWLDYCSAWATRLAGERDGTLIPKGVIVLSCQAVEVEDAPPPPFVTNTLCDVCYAELGLSPEKVMRVAERLYRDGLISHPVTTNPNIPDVEGSWKRISSMGVAWGTRAAKVPRRFPAILEAPNAGAIVPIDWHLPVGGSVAVDEVLYSLIWERALASQMVASRYSMLDVEACNSADERQRFRGTRISLIDPGWRRFTSRKDWLPNKNVNALGEWHPREMLSILRVEVDGVELGKAGSTTDRGARTGPRRKERSVV